MNKGEIIDGLLEYVEHDSGCVLRQYSAGRPTADGRYEEKYDGTWYEVRPENKRPACECGLNILVEESEKLNA